MKTNYKEKLINIKAFIFDVDGVLTDGSLLVSENGELLRTMNVKDGYAMKHAINKGFIIGIISGGTNQAVKLRLKNLGIEDVHLKSYDKIIHFNNFRDKHNLNNEDILVMGDDLPDIPIIKAAGLGCCPQDAAPEVKSICDYVSQDFGGKGCVRDIIEQVMKIHNKWT
jgi:3-deoxy-D-manno-octulosonate 8-phosphate phosphatase (KDO 8-P phosphatase)|tara:strand:+ start:555 stop:1058 length:504 start_codon:yes stop_codon:yes gene_type:complete